MKSILQNHHLQALFQEFTLGIEKESQRVTPTGVLAKTNHPQLLGSRDYHPYLQTDFAESQMELITPITKSIVEAMQWLAALHEVSQRSLESDERLWPLSMPLQLPNAQEVRVAQLSDAKEVAYREHLINVYGNRKQLVSGIHLNVGFSSDFFQAVFHALNLDTEEERRAYQNQFYFKQAKNFLKYEWLLTYLFAATPTAPKGYEASLPEGQYRSIRNSSYGYTNLPDVHVDYTTLKTYRQSIETLVRTQQLQLEKELYETVRLRGITSVSQLEKESVRYLEFRSFDLNPYAPYGIQEDDLAFIILFTKWLAWIEKEATTEEIHDGKQRKQQVALQPATQRLPYEADALHILTSMREMVLDWESPEQARQLALLTRMEELVLHPEQTIAARMLHAQNPLEEGLTLAQSYYDLAWHEPFSLKGFRHLELSTQILLFDAIQKGVTVDILDASDQFLQLTFDGKTEFLKNGNMTSHDTVSSMLAMANKTVTKKLLAQAGIHVPQGYEAASAVQAKQLWTRVQGSPIVVKPKSTNYGLGISILKDNQSQEDFEEAVDIAFQDDDHILIEEFITGTEYRFFVLNGETQAVLLRKPANVIGDGTHTIAELVDAKNEDYRRGFGHQYPLTKIDKGAIESLTLKQQGYTWESLPEVDAVVFLRDNSNISTGGDSVDMTLDMHDSYKRIAEAAATALQTTITGVDLLINDLTQPATIEDHDRYGIIEANFNPAMMMHIYPAYGTGRRLTLAVLKLLFPTLPI